MKYVTFLSLICILIACQAKNAGATVNIINGDQVITLQAEQNTLAAILAQAGILLSTSDKVQLRDVDLPSDFQLPSGGNFTLQIHRAHTLALITPDGQRNILTAASNVGQALAQAGLKLFAADFISPPMDTPILSDISVTYRPARDLVINVDGRTTNFKSSQQTVGQALTAAGFTMIGLDKSLPAEMDPLPPDGQIKIIRVTETISLQEKAIPFSKKIEYSVSIPAGQQKILQAGEPGLIISRIRTRFENGIKVAQTIEAETTVRQPTESIISLGSEVQIQTLDTPSGQIQYWRAVQMYTTSYSPCRSGTPKCSYGTASGMPVKQGVVAMIPSFYNQLAGSRVYIPGYGIGVVGDVGGGFPDGRLWIDLAYSDNDYQTWSGMSTVYFLSPAPANIPPGLK